MKKLATLLLSSLLVTVGYATEIGYRYLGKINTPSPAFISVEQFPGEQEFLLLSEFGALSSGKVSVIPNIKDIVLKQDFESAKTSTLFSSFKWPNMVTTVPQDVFGHGINAIIVPDGFLPPGKTEGNIYILTTKPDDITQKQQVYQLSANKEGYFYHTGFWVDIDGDGLKDFITARSNAKAGQGQLVWYKHPAGGLTQTPWQEEVIVNGPDVMFEIHDDIKGYEGTFVIFAAEFFNHKLTAYQIGKGASYPGKVLASKMIDDSIDQAYSVRYLDIDGDGQKDLLVNNHESDNAKAAIFTYTVPIDLFGGEYVRKTIANGFKNAFSLFIPNMCPGFPNPVIPGPNESMHILVAGDGDYSAHFMRPVAVNGDLTFKRETIKNLGGTVGVISAYDFDNDGYLEFFVPNYDKNYIEVYQFYDGPTIKGPEDVEDDENEISYSDEFVPKNPTEFLQ